jgi:hypothetical protein
MKTVYAEGSATLRRVAFCTAALFGLRRSDFLAFGNGWGGGKALSLISAMPAPVLAWS